MMSGSIAFDHLRFNPMSSPAGNDRVAFPAKAAVLSLLVLVSWHAHAESRISRILEGAYRQVGVTTLYDPGYRQIAFPGGDVPVERGVCSDVIVRAYRHAGLDLQLLVNKDMVRHFGVYPKLWGLSRPDSNIDHRRVANLATFFRRHGKTLPISSRAGDYAAGDLVTWRLPSGASHIGLVADRSADGRPLIVHNIGAGTKVDDILFGYPITGHFRYDPEGAPR